MSARFVLHYNPRSRAQRIRWLLEEAGAPYDLARHDFAARTHKAPEFLALNPDGKLPTLVDRGPDGAGSTVVTESAAIVLHVADACPEAGLAPAIGDPARGAYLNWIVYSVAAIEPALLDEAFPRGSDAPASAVGWPPYAGALDRVAAALSDRPYLLGEAFSAADIAIGSFLFWVRGWGKLPEAGRFAGYLDRLAARPAYIRAESA
ncbi:glutathione S-transferase [Methylopila jiangsuensis]|uniref:Glutathione S-transferase n=1 Tax=Methylopila jiangsuensis TaxID=586230 RepID=A0A9W6N455_9HYPH|nr:glutathione S-transferase family protein [Methylopila jiangsuensis]MDR6286650.1 glutathione S-transferase [Methylopila jiangsuensis]GLK77008.1 glutathione S-transferase [Methylopila jiangsuensis]